MISQFSFVHPLLQLCCLKFPAVVLNSVIAELISRCPHWSSANLSFELMSCCSGTLWRNQVIPCEARDSFYYQFFQHFFFIVSMEYFGRIKSKICGLCDNNKILQRVLFMEWKKQMNNKQTNKTDTRIGGWRGIMKCSLFHYSCSKISIIPVQKISLFRYSRKTKAIIPLQKFPLFLFHYSSSFPEQEYKFWLHWIHWQIDKKKRYIYSIENANLCERLLWSKFSYDKKCVCCDELVDQGINKMLQISMHPTLLYTPLSYGV